MHPTIGILTKRVSHVTGLRTDTFQDESELLQVRTFTYSKQFAFTETRVRKKTRVRAHVCSKTF